jgi:hypothetical protein
LDHWTTPYKFNNLIATMGIEFFFLLENSQLISEATYNYTRCTSRRKEHGTHWPHEPFLPWFYPSSLCPDQASPSIPSPSDQFIKMETDKLYLRSCQIQYGKIDENMQRTASYISSFFSKSPALLGMT